MGFPKFEIYKGKNDEYYFRLLAKNGENILNSEGYKSKQGCENGIESVKSNSPDDERYERNTASNGKLYFNLTAPNNQVIGTSQMYTTEQARDNGIEAVKRNAPNAPVENNS